MIDFGFDKLALIGAVALIVIGPERLPKVARTVGHLLGKAQRYVADVKAEVNRSIELDELKKMKDQYAQTARDVEQQFTSEIQQASAAFNPDTNSWGMNPELTPEEANAGGPWVPPPVAYKHPKKNWRLKRSAMPQWYKQRHGIRGKAQSGAARVARFRPPRRPLS
jgi:sec-independent protein translocase protein TatB